MEESATQGGKDNRKIILIVGAVAVVIAIVLLIALTPREPEVDPYVVKLEQDVGMYTGQIDSLNAVVDGLNTRLNTIRSQMDSVRASNRTLLASLHKVANEMKEYRRLYREQQKLNKKLVAELSQVKTEKERATTEVRQLKTQIDSMNNELYDKTVRLVRLESSLEEAVVQTRTMQEVVTSVLVCVGTEDELKRAGYLKTWRPAIFSKDYRVINFPDMMDEGSQDVVMRISLGETLALHGELKAVADRHGKLDKGQEYEVSKGPPGQTLVTFIDPTLQGQRVLAVVKRD